MTRERITEISSITKNTTMSLGLVVVLIGGVWWLTNMRTAISGLGKDMIHLDQEIKEVKDTVRVESDRIRSEMQQDLSKRDFQKWVTELIRANPTVQVPQAP